MLVSGHNAVSLKGHYKGYTEEIAVSDLSL